MSIIKINGDDVLYKIEYSINRVYYVTKNYEVYRILYAEPGVTVYRHLHHLWDVNTIVPILRDSSNVYEYDV